MEFLIYSSAYAGNSKNVKYPNRHLIQNKDDLVTAIRNDHVCGKYKDDYRNVDNFEYSNTLVMDIDNDESDDPESWMDLKKIETFFDGVSFAIATSRNHKKQKGDKAARPKYHLYFTIPKITSAKDYADLKRKVASVYPFFDSNAVDAARFIYGNPDVHVKWIEGYMSIADLVETVETKDLKHQYGSIKQGGRNNFLSRYAGRIVKRFGVSDKAKSLFEQRASLCDPPLEDKELESIWNSASKFAKKVANQDGYIKPDDYNNDFSLVCLKPEDFSDIGQAKVLAREYADELCYSDATDYLRYNGELWVESKQASIAAVEEFLDLQYEDACEQVGIYLDGLVSLGQDKQEVINGGKKYEESLDEKTFEMYRTYKDAVAYRNFVLKRRDMKYLISAMQAAKPMLEVDIKDLDANEFLLNTPGVTYDLKNGLKGKKEPDPKDLITKQTLLAPDEKGQELWNDALEIFFSKDQELIEYVQRIVGLAAIGKVYVEALIIAYGEGRNGKSTFWNSISRVLGSYAGGISADALTMGCRRNIKPEMAELKGKRLIIAAELEEGMRLNNSIVKQLCSTDNIQGEKKFKDPFSFVPSHTVVLYTNHLPRVGANDAGIWRRLIVIPFNAKIEGDSDIKNYSDYLVEKAGGAIVSWIIEGAKKAIEDDFKFTMPTCVKEAVENYKEDNDWLGHFINDVCEVGKGLECKSSELYQEYRNYCQRSGEYTRSTNDFYAGLEKANFIKKKKASGSFVQGLQVKNIDFLD